MKKKKVSKIANVFGRKMVAEVIETFKKAKEFEKQLHDLKKITKKNAPEFIATDWLIEKKDDLPEFGNGQNITMTINMVSSGNTSKITKAWIIDYVMNNWNTIKYDENNIR